MRPAQPPLQAAPPPRFERAPRLFAARSLKSGTFVLPQALPRSGSPTPTLSLPPGVTILPARHAPTASLRPVWRCPSQSLRCLKRCAWKKSRFARRTIPKANSEIERALRDPVPPSARPRSKAPDRSAAPERFPRAVSFRPKILPANGRAPPPDSPPPEARRSVSAPTPHPAPSPPPCIPEIPAPSDADTPRNPAASIPGRIAMCREPARCPRRSTALAPPTRASPSQ